MGVIRKYIFRRKGGLSDVDWLASLTLESELNFTTPVGYELPIVFNEDETRIITGGAGTGANKLYAFDGIKDDLDTFIDSGDTINFALFSTLNNRMQFFEFSRDGLYCYTGNWGNVIDVFQTVVPFRLNDMSLIYTWNIGFRPTSGTINDDGTIFYMADLNQGAEYQRCYELSTPYDLSTRVENVSKKYYTGSVLTYAARYMRGGYILNYNTNDVIYIGKSSTGYISDYIPTTSRSFNFHEEALTGATINKDRTKLVIAGRIYIKYTMWG